MRHSHGQVHRKCCIRFVHNGENIAGVDQLALDDIDLLYLSIDPGAHRRDVSVNVRVIRTCIEYRITNETRRTHGDYYHERCNDHYFVVEPESGTVCDRSLRLIWTLRLIIELCVSLVFTLAYRLVLSCSDITYPEKRS